MLKFEFSKDVKKFLKMDSYLPGAILGIPGRGPGGGP